MTNDNREGTARMPCVKPDRVSLRTKTVVELRTLHRQAGWLLNKLTRKQWVKAEYLAMASEQAGTVALLLDLLSRGTDPQADFAGLDDETRV